MPYPFGTHFDPVTACGRGQGARCACVSGYLTVLLGVYVRLGRLSSTLWAPRSLCGGSIPGTRRETAASKCLVVGPEPPTRGSPFKFRRSVTQGL